MTRDRRRSKRRHSYPPASEWREGGDGGMDDSIRWAELWFSMALLGEIAYRYSSARNCKGFAVAESFQYESQIYTAHVQRTFHALLQFRPARSQSSKQSGFTVGG
jgi:hypothetical protein